VQRLIGGLKGGEARKIAKQAKTTKNWLIELTEVSMVLHEHMTEDATNTNGKTLSRLVKITDFLKIWRNFQKPQRFVSKVSRSQNTEVA
jgi:hypothetical protein